MEGMRNLSLVLFLDVKKDIRFMTDAARREQESLKKKIQPKLSLTLSSTVSRGNVSTPPRHSSGSLTPPVTPPITPSSSFRSSTPTGISAANILAQFPYVKLSTMKLSHGTDSCCAESHCSTLNRAQQRSRSAQLSCFVSLTWTVEM
uniref:Uncharacterized protein n=1 Tax=Meleagris gallopavo TaxID=9103 RepID=A0A803XZ04_MELGA